MHELAYLYRENVLYRYRDADVEVDSRIGTRDTATKPTSLRFCPSVQLKLFKIASDRASNPPGVEAKVVTTNCSGAKQEKLKALGVSMSWRYLY